ncbi:hypothetical protein GJAV_G00133180 [Gymnothorax javanicus]|nr:hypothetical protein GJAV_G00133180 [Gymnothorax javanicus]
MITTRRVSPDKPEVRIAFSLDEPKELKDEVLLTSFPDLEQQLQPVLPCQSIKESVQIYRDHCKMATEFHQVKTEIALLEDRKKELIAELVEDEKASMEIARLEEEFRVLTEENQTLVTVHSQRFEQLETLRVLTSLIVSPLYRCILTYVICQIFSAMSFESPRSSVFTFQSSVHSSHVLHSLNEQRKSDILCDLTVVVESKSYRAHRSVLASCSEYFHTRVMSLVGPGLVITLPDEVTVEGFDPLLQFAYTAKLLFTRENILEIRKCATILGFHNLDKSCFDFLIPRFFDSTRSTRVTPRKECCRKKFWSEKSSKKGPGSAVDDEFDDDFEEESRDSERFLEKQLDATLSPKPVEDTAGGFEMGCQNTAAAVDLALPSLKHRKFQNACKRESSSSLTPCSLFSSSSSSSSLAPASKGLASPKNQWEEGSRLARSVCSGYKPEADEASENKPVPAAVCPAPGHDQLSMELNDSRGLKELLDSGCSQSMGSAGLEPDRCTRGPCGSYALAGAAKEEEDEEEQKGEDSDTERASECSSTQRVPEVQLPFPVEQIISLSRNDFQKVLKQHQLTKEQMDFVHDVRRRRKNCIAARLCRKRKLDCIYNLECEIEKLRSEKETLEQEKARLTQVKLRTWQDISGLCQKVFREAALQPEQLQVLAKYSARDCPLSTLLTPTNPPSTSAYTPMDHSPADTHRDPQVPLPLEHPAANHNRTSSSSTPGGRGLKCTRDE